MLLPALGHGSSRVVRVELRVAVAALRVAVVDLLPGLDVLDVDVQVGRGVPGQRHPVLGGDAQLLKLFCHVGNFLGISDG